MTTPKCPICGTGIAVSHNEFYEANSRCDFVHACCYQCGWRTIGEESSEEEAIRVAEEFVDRFTIAARLHYHDELYVDGHPEPVKLIAIQPNTTSLLLVEGSDGKLFWTAEHNVDKWPWEEWPGRIYGKEVSND